MDAAVDPDATLLLAYAHGDAAAFEMLYARSSSCSCKAMTTRRANACMICAWRIRDGRCQRRRRPHCPSHE